MEAALASVRPLLSSHGGDVELLELDEEVGAVRLRLLGSCDGCPSSAITLQSAVEGAILKAAPEIVCIDVDPRRRPPPVFAVAIEHEAGLRPMPDRGGAPMTDNPLAVLERIRQDQSRSGQSIGSPSARKATAVAPANVATSAGRKSATSMGISWMPRPAT